MTTPADKNGRALQLHPEASGPSHENTRHNGPPSRRPPSFKARLSAGSRLLLLSAALLAANGFIGHGIGWILLTTTLGPTAYLLLAHPERTGPRVRDAVMGHTAATACGLACLAAFGLWNQPSGLEQHHDTLPQIGAQALAVGATLFILTLFCAHHPPAAATGLLITSGITRPGPLLYGMLTGLAIVICGSALLAKTRWHRRRIRPGLLTSSSESAEGQPSPEVTAPERGAASTPRSQGSSHERA
ncbi:HPP family protein [Streptomyces sp. NPDC001848]|uniref:HPP family protein n=1 Tax=Streptomyces sp. NPDC001848 TaxID=3364618 RepID=UPI00368E40E4